MDPPSNRAIDALHTATQISFTGRSSAMADLYI